MGTRAGLRDSRYSRTANTVHGAGGKGTQSGKFLEVLLVLFTDTSTGRVEQRSKVWTSNCCWVEDGGSWHWLAEGRLGVGRVSRERDSWRFGDRQRKRSWQEAQTLFSSSMLFFSLWPHHLPNHCLSPSPISHLVTQSNTS